MRVCKAGILQTYYQGILGNRIRKKVIGKVWPEHGQKIQASPVLQRPVGILEVDRFSPLRELAEIAGHAPDQVLIACNSTKYTSREVFSNVKRLANGLKRIGIEPGDKVALMALPHERELFESFFAVQAVGAVPTLVNFLNPPGTIAYMFACSGAKALIVGRDFRLRCGAKKLALAGLLEKVVTIGDIDYGEAPTKKYLISKFSELLPFNIFSTYESLVESSELNDNELVLDPSKDAEAIKLFTSGTSKTPRVMTYTYNSLARVAESAEKRFQITQGDVWLFGVPFYHLAGLMVFCGALNYKGLLVLAEIPRASKPRTVAGALMNILENNVTVFPGVPRIIEPVLEEALNKGTVLPSLRLIFSGAAPMTPKLVNLVQKLNERRAQIGISPINVVNFYASTECGPISSTIKPVTLEAIDSLGVPFDDVSVKLSDDGNDELLVSVPEFPLELTDEALTSDGFFKTGDQVSIADDHTLSYLDRLTDCLNVNGEKISPLIIQRELEKLPGVKEAHVFGVPKVEEKTDIVCAVVVPERGEMVTHSNIQASLERRLPPELKGFIPRVIFIEPSGIPDALIRGPGKTPRRLFRGIYGDRALEKYSQIKRLTTLSV